MKKLNKILSVITALAMILCGLAACNGDTQDPSGEPSADVFTVNCVDENGAPVSGVLLLFTHEDGSTDLAITTADGMLQAELVSSVTVTTVPNGYTCDQTVYPFGNTDELTIVFKTVEAEDNTVSYSVSVVDQDGNPVSGVELQFCDEDSCRQPVITDENGQVCEKYIESSYHVTVNSMPEGYSAAEAVYYFGDGETEMTIVLNAD